MNNITSVLLKAKKYLVNNSIRSANIDSEILLSSVLKKSRNYLIINSLIKIDQNKINIFNKLVERRKKGEPIAYILKKKDFWKSTFYVDKNVLIPRPDTEILIEEILCNYRKKQKLSILDIGTGSGCIIISILKERQNFKGTAIDISKSAINVAKYNAKIHQLENRIKFYKTCVDKFFKGKYDLIISNPPYINKLDLKYLEKDVIGFEPNLALEGGIDGFTVLRKVIKKSSRLLKKGGKLILEIGFDQKLRARELLKEEKYFVNKISRDYGNRDRCIISTKL
jgi:release factor glutamine methyltransferase